MELFVESMKNTETLCGPMENRWDIADWKSINLNEKHKITTIQWTSVPLHGSLCLKWASATVQKLDRSFNTLCGCLDLSDLPSEIRQLRRRSNAFLGPIDLTCLPKTLERLVFADNRLSGILNLNQLSQKFKSFDAGHNEF